MLFAVSVCGVLVCTGCARSIAEDSAVDQWPSPDDQLDFLDAVETRHAVTNHDAIHGLLLFDSPESSFDSYEDRYTEAVSRGWVSGSTLNANESARVGMVAAALCSILDIDGGVTMRVFGNVPRYATRELVFLDILPPRTEGQSLTGLEFVDLLRKAGEWRRQSPDFILENAPFEETAAAADANETTDGTSTNVTTEEGGDG